MYLIRQKILKIKTLVKTSHIPKLVLIADRYGWKVQLVRVGNFYVDGFFMAAQSDDVSADDVN